MTERIYHTETGNLLLIAVDDRLVYCNWESPACHKKLINIKRLYASPPDPHEETVIKNAVNQLDEYFQGKRSEFQLPLSFHGTSFQIKVWKAIASIPYGDVTTYSDIAEKIGKDKAVRALAQACGANPLAIILPCHRVVSKNGEGGYTGGIEKKRKLLALEKSIKKF